MRGYLVDKQHSVSGVQQLVEQRAFFAAAFPETPDDLYARSTEGVVGRERERVVVSPHSHLSTNTFFGRFPVGYWQCWPDVMQIELGVIAQGTGRISIRASDVAGEARTVAATLVVGAMGEKVRLVTRADHSIEGTTLWLEASTDAAELVLEAACWSVATRETATWTAAGCDAGEQWPTRRSA